MPKPPPQHRLPPEAAEPPFETFGPSPLDAHGEPAPASGAVRRPRGGRPGGLGLLPVMAVGLTLGLCGALFVVRPLRRELLVAHEHLAQAVRANEALQKRLEAVSASVAPDAGPRPSPRAETCGADHGQGQPSAWQPDGLTAALAAALDVFVARGEVAVHPNEASVHVIVPADVAQGDALATVAQEIARALQAEGGTWQVAALAGRPVKSLRRAKLRAWRSQTAAVVAMLDGAFGTAQVKWTLTLAGIKPGQVVLVVRPGPA